MIRQETRDVNGETEASGGPGLCPGTLAGVEPLHPILTAPCAVRELIFLFSRHFFQV